MKYKLLIGASLLALTLSACATNLERNILVACQGYASTLTILASQRAAGRLTNKQVTVINILRPGLNEICLDGNFSDPTAAYNIVQDGMFKLIQIERSPQ